MSKPVEVEVVQETPSKLLPKIDDKAIAELKEQYDKFRKLQRIVLEEDVDYGYPSGKRQGKPSLYKSGAEKLTRLFNLVPEFEIVERVEQDDFIMYAFKCLLKTPSGMVVGTGFGACNSREKKHWNENPWANQNTILKMAKKRAHVDAVLTGLGASNVFTQDLEDMEEDIMTAEETPSQSPKATEPQIRKLMATLREYASLTGKSIDELKESIKAKYQVEHINDLTKQEASELIDELTRWIEKHKAGDNR